MPILALLFRLPYDIIAKQQENALVIKSPVLAKLKTIRTIRTLCCLQVVPETLEPSLQLAAAVLAQVNRSSLLSYFYRSRDIGLIENILTCLQ